ncbi:EutP/PduV family microcompartment system protein [Peribacillus frigoritolerans]|uniref:EutP/PduV family microcompartment system protein n=1 Tax=Peribacillus frigoritolerans TaxID=450367 RepID=A0AAJ1VDD8_9BACI|nr:EutP/PduV family microcompartment system protein [Peribacillus frigoritolerans]MDM5286407.1 EutP/PduV family microcompartment system protein [Peribacillus frigoritolerans]
MKRIVIIGSVGSGKSTLTKQLGEMSKRNVYHGAGNSSISYATIGAV